MDTERRGHINRPTSLMGSVVGVKGNSKPSGMVSNGNAVNKYTNGSTGKQPLPPPDISNSNNGHSSSGKSEQRSSCWIPWHCKLAAVHHWFASISRQRHTIDSDRELPQGHIQQEIERSIHQERNIETVERLKGHTDGVWVQLMPQKYDIWKLATRIGRSTEIAQVLFTTVIST